MNSCNSGDFVWGDGGKPPPFIASALHEESGFSVSLCRGACNLKHACCGGGVKARRAVCKTHCSEEGARLRAEAEAAVYGNGGNGGGNGGGPDYSADIAADLAEAERELKALRDQLLAGTGGNGGNGGFAFGGAGGGKTNWGTIAAIVGVVIGIIVMIMMYKKK